MGSGPGWNLADDEKKQDGDQGSAGREVYQKFVYEKLAGQGNHRKPCGNRLLVETGAEDQERVCVRGCDQLGLDDEQDDLDEKQQEGGDQNAIESDAVCVEYEIQQV